ncbi:MAG: hypothetical protein U5L98_06700 [Halomonas sp.]|uniref:hypothetical protein n=1 Tax=Halomonas sp. TaxID=1486246 RepID=UPI002ACD73EB|nr:hypothetical protein [Halomonas sp.]MDZ7852332.1 hypothetical protein [Halomonas sp.]
MLDDAILEASRLLASLRSMRAAQTVVDEAELALSALEHGNPSHHTLDFVADALERIDSGLPHGALAGFVRVRLRHLAGMVAAMQDNTPTPPSAA